MAVNFARRYSLSLRLALGLMAAPLITAAPAKAAGDLLVAPTRIVLDGKRGAEVILNNIGNEEATYRISLELRRMNNTGKLDDVPADAVNEKETQVKSIIRYAPRRVTLPPDRPQSIRIGLSGTEALPDGEYRAHMSFRAIPKVRPVTASTDPDKGVQIQLIPLYGVTIPIIIRKGKLEAKAALANPRLEKDEGGHALRLDLSRTGTASVFGEIRVKKTGQAEPLVFRGIAIYPEIDARTVTLPIDEETSAGLKGPVTIGYYTPVEDGGILIAEVKSVLQ